MTNNAHLSLELSDSCAGKRAEVARDLTLLNPTQFYGSLLDSLEEAILVKNEVGEIVYANAAAHTAFGYARGELVGTRVTALRGGRPDEIEQQRAAVKERLATRKSWHGELLNRRRNGEHFSSRVHYSRTPGPAGQQWYCERHDFTRLSGLEALARRTKAHLEELGDTIDEVFVVSAPRANRVDYVSPAFEKVWGRSREEFTCNPEVFLISVHPDDRERVTTGIEELYKGDSNYLRTEFRIIRPDGDVRWISSCCMPVRDEAGAIQRFGSVAIDVTDRKLTEAALGEWASKLETRVAERTDELATANARLQDELAERCRIDAALSVSESTNRALLAAIPDRIFRIRRDGRSCVQVPTQAGMSIWPEGNQIKMIQELVPVDVARQTTRAVEVTLDTGALQCFDFQLSESDVSLDFESRVVPFAEDEALVIVRDVTEHKLVEKRLRASENRLRSVLDAIGVFVGLMSPDGILLEVNESVLLAGHVPREAVIGRHLWDTHWFAYAADVQHDLRQACERAGRGESARVDLVVQIRGNKKLTVDASLTPLRNERGEVELIVGSGIDVTARLKAGEELRQLHQRLTHVLRVATVDEMAAGIAHELNQPLTSINNYSHTMRKILGQAPANLDPRLALIAAQIGEQSQRAGEIVRGLRDLVRKGTLRYAPSDLNDLIRRALALVMPDIKLFEIKLETRYAPDLPKVSVDAVQIQQVVLNLVRNSIDAIDGSQSVERIIRVQTARHDESSARIIVADTGPGIEAADLEGIFNAFYTTKATGLGMGLPLSRSIVEAHGGRLSVESLPGMGAIFQLTLPFSQLEYSGRCLTN